MIRVGNVHAKKLAARYISDHLPKLACKDEDDPRHKDTKRMLAVIGEHLCVLVDRYDRHLDQLAERPHRAAKKTKTGDIVRLANHNAGPKRDSEVPPTTGDQLALTFADRYAEHLRYVAGWSRWMFWDEDDFRWQHENTLAAFDWAREICRGVALTCVKTSEMHGILSAKTVAAVERMAKANRRIAATMEHWDADP